jgi:tetratricopeptide (TPR) repeat protein
MYRERRSEFLEEYRDQTQKMDDYAWTVYTTWTVSFEKLSRRAAMFLNVCAFFHHEGISRSMFQKATTNVEARGYLVSNGLEMAKDVLSSFRSANGHWDLHKFLTIMMEVSSYSLIDYDERNETYSIHPLVHAWTRSRLSDSTTVRESSQIILSLSIDSSNESKDIGFRRTLLPHIDASLRCGTSVNSSVLWWLSRPYCEGGRWKEAEKLQDLVTKTNKRVLGEDHLYTLASMLNLAYTYSGQGRLKEAEELEVRVMETRKRILGDDHPSTLISMSNLACTYSNQGRHKEAEELLEKVMEIRKRVLGDDHPDTLTSMSNLAYTYSTQGREKESEELRMRMMESMKQVLGDDHPSTLTSMSNLASTYSNQGRHKEAEEIQVRVMGMRRQVLGDDHPDTLTIMSNLAYTYSSQGREKEAKDLLMQAVQMSKMVLGENHPDTLERVARLA